MYGEDVLKGGRQFGKLRTRKVIPEVEAELDLVVEDADSGFCGAIVGFELGAVVLEDRFGKTRNFPLTPAAFLLDGARVTLTKPQKSEKPELTRTASGSIAVAGVKAQVAKASRIWVEGIHDAALIERIWGDDLRIEGIVVEPLDGIDDLAAEVRNFGPGKTRRLGVLVDHLVAGSKESRIVSAVKDPNVLVTGHPYIDVWQAVKPQRVGLSKWPVIPPGRPWKEGICEAVGVRDTADMWRRILKSVSSYKDVETPLVNSMERLIDFVTVLDE